MRVGNRILCVFSFAALCATALPCASQSGEITTKTTATAEEIEKWLDSGDSRLTAWGAYFAQANADDSATSRLLELVDEWQTSDGARNGASQLNADAMAEVLDALIQRNAAVPPETILAISNSFPAQAAILASRLSADDARPLLQAWYGQRKNNKRQPGLARIAAMMLAKTPPPGFAASVLDDSRERYTVLVVDPGNGAGTGYGGGGLGGCGSGVRADWPPVFQYQIKENSEKPGQPLVVEAGGDKLTYARGPLVCGMTISARSLNDETRHHLLLEMLGYDRSTLRWEPDHQQVMEWQGAGSFLAGLEEILRTERAKMRESMSALLDKGLLTADEAARTEPWLLVLVQDERDEHVPELPSFESDEPKTAVVIPDLELDRISLQ